MNAENSINSVESLQNFIAFFLESNENGGGCYGDPGADSVLIHIKPGCLEKLGVEERKRVSDVILRAVFGAVGAVGSISTWVDGIAVSQGKKIANPVVCMLCSVDHDMIDNKGFCNGIDAIADHSVELIKTFIKPYKAQKNGE